MNKIWMVFLSTLATTGCYANPVNTKPAESELTPASVSSAEQTDGMIKIRFDKTVSHENLEVRWLEINDSRCPIGENCFWAGEVKVKFEARRALQKNSKPVEFQLVLQARGKPVTAFVLGYEMKLLRVDPHPKKGVNPQRGSYMAKVKIAKAQAN